MRKSLKILFLIGLFLLIPSSMGACPESYNYSKIFTDRPVGTTFSFMGYSVLYQSFSVSPLSVTYFINGNEYGSGNTYISYGYSTTNFEDICSDNSNIHTIALHDDGYGNLTGNVSVQILVGQIINSTPTPTPTPTSTIPQTFTPTPTATVTGAPEGIGEYTPYDSSNESGTYSHIPSGSSGFNDMLKAAGYCTSGTCTGGDIVSFLAYYVNTFWWLTFVAVIVRFWNLQPKKNKDKRSWFKW